MVQRKKRSRKRRAGLAKIRKIARLAASHRLAGRINRATQLEKMVDYEVGKAEDAGWGGSAFMAEEKGKAQASSRAYRKKYMEDRAIGPHRGPPGRSYKD